MTSPGKSREYGECEDDYCERNRYRKPQPGQSGLFVIPFFHESTTRLARKCGMVKGNQPAPAFVCNAIKLSQFTAVKMSHPRRVLSSLFSEILTV
jgi:hypothetical protein